MDISHAVDWSRQALWMALLLGGPLLIAAFLVGLVVLVGLNLQAGNIRPSPRRR